MPICIECRYPVASLYTTYSKADDRALGKGVRLTQCPRCRRFADKYVEHDYVVLFVDLVLVKPQVYRHLLLNRLVPGDGEQGDKFDPSIVRLGVLLLLFDVYLTWARIERAAASHSPTPGANELLSGTLLASQPLLLQYLFFLVLCGLGTLAFHLPIRLLTTLGGPRSSSTRTETTKNDTRAPPGGKEEASAHMSSLRRLLPHYPHPNRISTALLLSSFAKLFPILMVIWAYDVPQAAAAVSWAALGNNAAALEILLGCGWARAALLAATGAATRAAALWAVLRVAGLQGGQARGLLL